MPTAEDLLQLEYNKAAKYADEFRERLKDEIDVRIEMYRLATDRFQQFLELREPSSIPLAIFEVAFTLFSTAIPILNIGKFIAAANNRASLAMFESVMRGEASGVLDRVKEATTRLAPKLAEKVKTGHSVVDAKQKIAAALKGTRATPAQAETSAIRGLLVNKLEATDLWDRATDALLAEYEARLYGQSTSDTLSDVVKRILGDIPVLKQTEIDELGMAYLHQILEQHVKVNRIGLVQTAGYEEVRIVGWNDPQKTQIRKWFNHNSPGKRGIYFQVPVVQNAVDYLLFLRVPIVVRIPEMRAGTR